MAVFEDIFDVNAVDPNGKRFDTVSRIECTGENYEMELTLDVNTDIYPIEVNQKFSFALATTLSLTGAPDDGVFDQSGRKSLLDKYDYAMYGKLYKHIDEPGTSPKVSVYVSFGGLLMKLRGDPRNLQGLELDSRIYLLMRKV